MKLTKIVDRRDYHILNRNLKQINRLAPQMAALTDEQLQHKTAEFKERLAQKATLDELFARSICGDQRGRKTGLRYVSL